MAPGYNDAAAWAEGCRQARAGVGATWNGMNLRAKQMACAARIAAVPQPAPRPAAPLPGPPGGTPGRGRSKIRSTLKSRRRKLKKGDKKRTRRAH